MNTTPHVTFLGPPGATFSHDAYRICTKRFGGPEVITSGSFKNYLQPHDNEHILPLVGAHGGYGVIAMETQAECRVTESVDSFIDLVKLYESSEQCPFIVAGAINMRISFHLMVNASVPSPSFNKIDKVIAHPKALGACSHMLNTLAIDSIPLKEGNGEAARRIAEDPAYKHHAVLGPKSASETYGLRILRNNCENEEAVTTFFFITPKDYPVCVAAHNRVLIAFKIPQNYPGALVDILLSYKKHGINMIDIHSRGRGSKVFDFGLQFEVPYDQILAFKRAFEESRKFMSEHIVFGPFQTINV